MMMEYNSSKAGTCSQLKDIIVLHTEYNSTNRWDKIPIKVTPYFLQTSGIGIVRQGDEAES